MNTASNITTLAVFISIVLAFIMWLLRKFRRDVHISKDMCIDVIVSRCSMSYGYGNLTQEWSSPLMGGDVATDDICGSGLYYWRVPTSIFFGLNPTTMGKAAYYNSEKNRYEIKVEVDNPAENRRQTETLKEASYTGVILRGGELYGWTSQNTDMAKFPSSLFYWASSPVAVASLEINSILTNAAESVKQIERTARRSACFNGKHWKQLCDIAAGRGVSTVEGALKQVLSHDKSSK